jgi:hypothetical protein
MRPRPIIIIIMDRGSVKHRFSVSGVITGFRTGPTPATVTLSAIFHTELLGIYDFLHTKCEYELPGCCHGLTKIAFKLQTKCKFHTVIM